MNRAAPPPAVAPGNLRDTERRALEAVLNTLLPTLEPQPGEDPTLFRLQHGSVGVLAAFEEALTRIAPADRGQLLLLLRLLERPSFVRLVGGPWLPFSATSHEERERVLLTLATSRAPVLRMGFQAMKRLACFLFYSVVDVGGTNPTWSGIGYAAPPAVPSADAPLVLTAVAGPLTLECDVCVIGSGAGGGVVAAELAAAGRSVIVLEAGPGAQAPDFDGRELAGMERFFLDRGLTGTSDLGVAILAGAVLGGGTTVNWQTSLRLPDSVRDEWADLSGCEFFREPRFDASMDAVTTRSSVSLAESAANPNNAALMRGCEALGYRFHDIPRNARGCDLEQCGYCMFGCRPAGKQSTPVTFLRDAQQNGARIVADCRAERVVRERGGVRAVEAIAQDRETGAEHRVLVQTREVVVAAGSLGSPTLLMRSGIDLPALGRNLYLHPTTGVGGEYGHPIEQWRGAPQSIVCDEFAELSGSHGFRLETVPAHPGLMALALPWRGARDHRRRMQGYSCIGSIIAIVRDRQGGRVRLTRNGRMRIDYRPGAREREHLALGMAAAVRVHLAAGAEEVTTLRGRGESLRRSDGAGEREVEAFCRRVLEGPVDRNHSTLFSAHQMGTCRMGQDRRTAVCAPDGQVFGTRGLFIADASAFPSSSGVNPMITVMALAHHIARGMTA